MGLNKKKIVYVLPTLNTGGAELQTINQLNYLHQKGNENIYLLILSSKIDEFSGLNLSVDNIGILDKNEHGFLSRRYLKKVPYLVKHTINFILKNEITDVIAILPPAHLVCRIAKIWLKTRNLNIKLFPYYRALDFMDYKRLPIIDKLFYSFNSIISRFTDNRSIFISQACYNNTRKHQFTREPLIIFNCLPFRNIGNELAIEYIRNHNIRKQDRFSILVPGRITPQKGHAFFLKAMKDFIASNHLNCHQLLIIIAGYGSPNDEELIRSEAAFLGGNIHITGRIRNELVLSFMNMCDIVVIPSLIEGLGNVAIEALMQKAIILASDAGGLTEIIQDGKNGFKFKAGNEDEFLTKLTFIYQNYSQNLLDKNELLNDFKNRFRISSYFKRFNNELGLELKV